MYQYEVTMETCITEFSLKVWADNKAKATYKAFVIWRGKELETYCKFGDFIKLFHKKTIQLDS